MLEEIGMSRIIDLNIFYREDYTEETGTTWSDTLTIDPYIYEEDDRGVRKHEVQLLIECTPEETSIIAKHYPQDEYGSDWWDFAENFLEFAPPRIASLIKAINVDNVTEPSWWITKTDDKLF